MVCSKGAVFVDLLSCVCLVAISRIAAGQVHTRLGSCCMTCMTGQTGHRHAHVRHAHVGRRGILTRRRPETVHVAIRLFKTVLVRLVFLHIVGRQKGLVCVRSSYLDVT